MDRIVLDARHWQIAALSMLLFYSIAGFDFGASAVPSAVAIASTLAAQYACSRIWRCRFDWRSPLITGLSLSLLLRTDWLAITALAGGLAILSKFALRIRGKHIWNPATFGIVAVLLGTDHVWISPGQWGTAVWTIALIGCFAILVLGRAGRWDTALAFLGAHAALLAARALWLGDPMAIPLHQMQSGSLLLFGCFMVTDPRTTPDRRAPRVAFAATVAALGHFLAFHEQLRPALYLSLAALAPLVPLLDLAFPAENFNWLKSPPQPSNRWDVMRMIRGMLPKSARAAGFALGFAGALASTATSSLAFCGFYVAQADAKLFNKASKVVLTRDGSHTAITMASDYEGDPKEFALVIPVPTIVAKDDIHVVSPDLVTRLDAYTAPRLTEYFDQDPCRRIYMDMAAGALASATMNKAMRAAESAEALGVTIEAKYEVGVYDILVLGAKESDGLVTWLKLNHYRIPDGAEDVLGSYIRQSMHFFVAKVNLQRQAKSGDKFLEPIQVSYDTPKFMLPIRLGTVNANGPQDLIIYAITRQGRIETANYRPAKMATKVDVPLFVHDDFGPVYKAAFDHAVENDGMRSIFLEYAWSLSAYCDPCSGTPPSPSDLVSLGAAWVAPPAEPTAPTMPQQRIVRPGNPVEGFVTRLHVRYDRAHFPEDLLLTETRDTEPFQVVYALHHPFTGAAACPAGEEYRKSLPARFEREAEALSDLTGWTTADIHGRMASQGETGAAAPR
jgi:hypothetical protein